MNRERLEWIKGRGYKQPRGGGDLILTDRTSRVRGFLTDLVFTVYITTI